MDGGIVVVEVLVQVEATVLNTVVTVEAVHIPHSSWTDFEFESSELDETEAEMCPSFVEQSHYRNLNVKIVDLMNLMNLFVD